MCYFICNFFHFREDKFNKGKCFVESDVLEESQQHGLQDDSIYDNVDDVQHHVYELSSKQESENVLEHSGYPEFFSAGSFPRHTSQVSHNPAYHVADGATSIATTKSSKFAPTVATG